MHCSDLADGAVTKLPCSVSGLDVDSFTCGVLKLACFLDLLRLLASCVDVKPRANVCSFTPEMVTVYSLKATAVTVIVLCIALLV